LGRFPFDDSGGEGEGMGVMGNGRGRGESPATVILKRRGIVAAINFSFQTGKLLPGKYFLPFVSNKYTVQDRHVSLYTE
jgi:hypothetical protein